MANIRKKNRSDQGPWLSRADTIHAKALNMFKSIGFEVKMEGLIQIELMMTNFNQIVMQNATVNKYYVSLDLPVYQLACEAQPLVSNSLVVRHSRIQTLVNLPRSEEETKNSTFVISNDSNSSPINKPYNLLEEFRKIQQNTCQPNLIGIKEPFASGTNQWN